jgi:hypothetical protein
MTIDGTHIALQELEARKLASRPPAYRSATACGIGPDPVRWGSGYLLILPSSHTTPLLSAPFSPSRATSSVRIEVADPQQISETSLAEVVLMHAQLVQPVQLEQEFIRALNIATLQAGKRGSARRRS